MDENKTKRMAARKESAVTAVLRYLELIAGYEVRFDLWAFGEAGKLCFFLNQMGLRTTGILAKFAADFRKMAADKPAKTFSVDPFSPSPVSNRFRNIGFVSLARAARRLAQFCCWRK